MTIASCLRPHALSDPGDVRFGDMEVHVRRPGWSVVQVARVLGVWPPAPEGAAGTAPSATASIYLDRLVHAAEDERIGTYVVAGGVATVLVGPRPDVSRLLPSSAPCGDLCP